MEFLAHKAGSEVAVEVLGEEVIIREEQDALDLMADIGYRFDSTRIILHRHQLGEAFWDLHTGVAGGILQKFSNYRVRLAVLGDYSDISSKSLREFMGESNKRRQVVFVPDLPFALATLSST